VKKIRVKSFFHNQTNANIKEGMAYRRWNEIGMRISTRHLSSSVILTHKPVYSPNGVFS
jgi:hypothetical protein